MKIEIKEKFDEDALIEGIKLSLTDDRNNTFYMFEKEYKKRIIKSGLLMIMSIVFFLLIFLFDYLYSKDYSAFLFIIFIFFFLIVPFLNVISIIIRFKDTNKLYNDMQIDNNSVLELSDFKIMFYKENNIIRSIYYSDLDCIKIYKHVIVFKCRIIKKSFFINAKYKDQLVSILSTLDLGYLVDV